MPIPPRLLSSGLLALLATALIGFLATPAAAAETPASMETRVGDLLNHARGQAGLRSLRIDVRIVAPTRDWSAEQARQGRLVHHPDLRATMPSGATAIAENIAYTSHTDDIAGRLHRLLMDSSSHRANILDGRFTELGIGIVQSGGRTYLTQRFSAGARASVAPAVRGLAEMAGGVFGSGGAGHAVLVRDDVFADALSAGPLAGAGGPILLTPPGPALHPAVRNTLERVLPRGRTVWLVGGPDAVSEGVRQELEQAGYAVRRASGDDRMATARSVAEHMVARDGRPDRVLVTTGWDWPDAISGGAYGARAGSPVLLTDHGDVPEATRAALRSAGNPQPFVVGGSAAVSDAVVGQLGATRIAGATRFGTASAAAARLWGYQDASPGTWIAVPALGDDAWTWALGAAPLSARMGAAMLLTGDRVDPEVRRYLDGLGYGSGRRADLVIVGPVPGSGADQLRSLLQ